ncbi:MAG: N-acetylmuramoyl-L-alanine amidase, partial [Bdellovibrionales bacterium]|nr:N-acetylmuramoyl-L-alanine amidase [Bdellovibrionales bacterium]
KDVFLPLDVRSRLAQDWKADLFLSLHVNSAPGFEAEGTETYILSADATDAAARKLALIENAIPEKAKKQGSAVQEILWDIQQMAYLQDSAYLASYIQEQVEAAARRLHANRVIRSKWKNRGVRQAPFFVLNRASMPAALVELGYVTNSRDRQLLTQRFFLESLARAVADGVTKYRDSCRKRR